MEPKESDKLQCFFVLKSFVVRVLIRFVDVANVETTYHHELLEYCFSENIKKMGVVCTRLSPLSLYSKNSPQLCTLLNPSLLHLKTFRSRQVALPALPASEAGGLGDCSREDKHN